MTNFTAILRETERAPNSRFSPRYAAGRKKAGHLPVDVDFEKVILLGSSLDVRVLLIFLNVPVRSSPPAPLTKNRILPVAGLTSLD
jgi:hypothetical protein